MFLLNIHLLFAKKFRKECKLRKCTAGRHYLLCRTCCYLCGKWSNSTCRKCEIRNLLRFRNLSNHSSSTSRFISKKCNSSAIEARFGCFTAFFAANTAKNLAYGRAPYPKYTKNSRFQTSLNSNFYVF